MLTLCLTMTNIYNICEILVVHYKTLSNVSNYVLGLSIPANLLIHASQLEGLTSSE